MSSRHEFYAPTPPAHSTAAWRVPPQMIWRMPHAEYPPDHRRECPPAPHRDASKMSFQHDRRIILYPHYLDSTKAVSDGRRIPKDKGERRGRGVSLAGPQRSGTDDLSAPVPLQLHRTPT